MTILDTIFTTTASGMYADFWLDNIAEKFGVTVDEADAFIDALVTLNLVVDIDGDIYNATELADYEAAEAEEIEDWNQYLIDSYLAAFAA